MITSSPAAVIEKDVVVLGAGISGIATAKCLKDDGFDVVILERSSDVGGLWTFRENDYGVMRFTHINVSKYNYSFSDFPFPESTPDYPHHTEMAQYIKDYVENFELHDLIKYNMKVLHVEQIGEKWRITGCRMEEDGQKGTETDEKVLFVSSFVAVTTGHHAQPSYPKFKGEETFPGEIIHSVDYNDAITNNFVGKRVLVVGIGNSAVDVAVDCASVGRCPSVYLSTRSGAWIIPNYIFGFATDLYACRFFFTLPRAVASFLFENIVSLVSGNPWRWGLNPKMGVLQTQPTVSPTLIHHIQRRKIQIAPNIAKIEGSKVHFVKGNSADFDKIVYCTGYKIDLPFLSESLKRDILEEGSNTLKLYKNVFSPEVGPSLAFIGFVQPASGGILTMSEIQARWFSKLCKGKIKLPSKFEMDLDIKEERKESKDRWYQSARHTIQKDPIIYNDEIAAFIGAKPDLLQNPLLAWRLLFSSCGAAQWRLQGPNKWAGAMEQVRKTPLTTLMNCTGWLLLGIMVFILWYVLGWISAVFNALA